MTCRICRASGDFPRHSARERMFGSGQAFDYLRCTACGCLQIEAIPQDLEHYYPADYYSYDPEAAKGWRAALRRARNRALLRGGHAWLAWLQPYEALAAVAGQHLPRQARILDVGCGRGQLVNALREQGYAQTCGIDPFLAQDLSPWIQKRSLANISGHWDLIMLHHSLEHLPDPHQAFAEIRRLLAPHGRVLIRVPTVDSWAFSHYGDCWVQWDPPRHLYLFSRQNLDLLAAAHGLQLRALWDDSAPLQFWGSEGYRKGLMLAQIPTPMRLNPWYRWQAARLNARGQGDMIVCLLSRA
ncbi:MAG: hypothetical protein CVV27_11150 [Candidatus Melainabacteria bacterium HGW-Melainabacteria-1]|nr:MAG: hypothetical protein CVV27_11150 [Candidatus Melainabacteria bacterium HGW-Melainabacteria-1]